MGSSLTGWWDEQTELEQKAKQEKAKQVIDTVSYNALVLIGNHGVGKDTLANRLVADADYCMFYNCKMSALYKDFFKDVLHLNANEINGQDDAKRRERPLSVKGKDYPFSALDLLNLMFKGSLTDDRFVRKHCEYALNSIPKNAIPVFTDVRRKQELDAINERYRPLVVFLGDPDVPPSEADSEIAGLFSSHLILKLKRGQQNEAYKTLTELITPLITNPIREYAVALLKLNEHRLPKNPKVNRNEFIAAVVFGLIEELTEYALASTVDEKIAEAGDVMAYVVLSLIGLNYAYAELPQAVQYIRYMLTESASLTYAQKQDITLTSIIHAIAGDTKRLYREGGYVDSRTIILAFAYITRELESAGISLERVLKYNIEKLTKRASAGTLFQGKGNHR